MLPPSDPLSEALAETAALLRTLGIADPLDKLRPVFAKVRQRWAGERVHIARADAGSVISGLPLANLTWRALALTFSRSAWS